MILFSKRTRMPPLSPRLGRYLLVCAVGFAADSALVPTFAQQATTPSTSTTPSTTTTPSEPSSSGTAPSSTTSPQASPLRTTTSTTTAPGTTAPGTTTGPSGVSPSTTQPRRGGPLGAPKEATTARSESVLRRPLMDRPYGYDVGSFIFHAQGEAGVEYDDNILRSNSFPGNPTPIGDTITRIAPSATLQSNWEQHAIGISVGSEFDFYLNNPSQNYINYNGGIDGRYDINEEQQITGVVQYYRQVLPRGTPGVGVVGGQSFTNVLSADAKYLYTGEPWYLRIGPKFEYRTFEGSAPSANYNFFGFSARVGYRVTEDFSVFIDPSLQIYRYPGGVDFTGFDPNSQGYDFKAGVTYDLGSEVGLEAAVGYYQQWYQKCAL